MDKRPKRSRDKYNLYSLNSEKAKGLYEVTFFMGKEKIKVNLSKNLFDQFEEFEKEDARQIRKHKRNDELNTITENTLNKRAINKPDGTDEIVIKKIHNERLARAMEKLTKQQRRRILLYYDYQLTMEEIARIEGCSKQSVQESIEWGIKKLQKYF